MLLGSPLELEDSSSGGIALSSWGCLHSVRFHAGMLLGGWPQSPAASHESVENWPLNHPIVTPRISVLV